MEKEKLIIRNYVKGDNTDPYFYDSKNPIIIKKYTCSKQRMGISPTMSAVLMFDVCLDTYWNGTQYVMFQGERYFIFKTPSSSESEKEIKYKHEIQLYCERNVLNGVYFLDAFDSNLPDEKLVSNNTSFTFWGNINDFVLKLNNSAKKSKLRYSFVVDSDITDTTEHFMEFNRTLFGDALSKAFDTFNIPFYFIGNVCHFGYTPNAITQVFEYGAKNQTLSISKNNAGEMIIRSCSGVGSTDNIPYYYPNDTPDGKCDIEYSGSNTLLKKGMIDIVDEYKFYQNISLTDNIVWTERETLKDKVEDYLLQENIYWRENETNASTKLDTPVVLRRDYNNLDIYIIPQKGYDTYPIDISIQKISPASNPNISIPFKKDGVKYVVGALQYDKIVITWDLSAYRTASENTDSLICQCQMVIDGYYNTDRTWNVNGKKVKLEDLGLKESKTFQVAVNDSFSRQVVERLPVSANLLPSIYRRTKGEERFYKALNNTYINKDTGDYYKFENLYNDNIPSQDIIDLPDIKPTIVGITNASGQLIGEFINFAYDENDNDELNEKGEYKHSYFYAKLRKFDGANGFNLFDSAIAKGEMSVLFDSGDLVSSEHKIGAVELGNNRFANPVQVDSNGDIVQGDYAQKVNKDNLQPQQQDTSKNEVWIALQKVEHPLKMVVPNANLGIKPKAGDKFKLINIGLPKQYILAAEDRVEDAVIKSLVTRNRERFDFKIDFRPLYLAENPNVSVQINDNARLIIRYDNRDYTLYVSNYTYKTDSDDILPRIEVQLNDKLTISKDGKETLTDNIKDDLMNNIINYDFLKQGLKYFIRKDIDDRTAGKLSSNKGFEVGEYLSGLLGKGAWFGVDNDGKTRLEVDVLYARIKAYFDTLEINKVQANVGNRIQSSAGIVCNKVEDKGSFYRCYFKNKEEDREIKNDFIIGDQAYCRIYNLKRGTKYYWRLVVSIGDDYIDLSKNDRDLASNDIPAIEDNIIQLGNRNDKTRQNAIVESTSGGNSPSYIMYQGINSFTLAGCDIISMGYDSVSAKAYMRAYGDAYIGSRDGSSYIKNDTKLGKVSIKGDVDITGGSARKELDDIDGVLKNLSDDNLVTPTEKPYLGQEIVNIDAINSILQTEVANLGLIQDSAYTTYQQVYTAYKALLNELSAPTPENISLVGKNYDSIRQNFYTAKVNLENRISAKRQQDIDKDIANANKALDDYKTLNDKDKANINTKIEGLESQVDGAIQGWEGTDIPTLTNKPAVDWTTDVERKKHQKDFYRHLGTKDGKVVVLDTYDFMQAGGVWQWVLVGDTMSAETKKVADDAFALAGEKNKVFFQNTPPAPPYKVNDVWVDTDDNSIYLANKDKASGSTVQEDWQIVNNTMYRISQMADDNVISKEEKVRLKEDKAQIDKEIIKYREDATKYPSTEVTNALSVLNSSYSALNSGLMDIYRINVNEDTKITNAQKDDVNNRFASYYVARTQFANAIAKSISDKGIEDLEIGGVNRIVSSLWDHYSEYSIILEKNINYISWKNVNGSTQALVNKHFNDVQFGRMWVFSGFLKINGKIPSSCEPIFSSYQTLISFKYDNITGYFVTIQKKRDNDDWLIHSNVGALNDIIRIDYPMLELGNKATDWSPAPEDIQTQIDALPKYQLDLTNDNSSVACDKDGNVIGAYPTSKANVYAGSGLDSGWTFSGVGTNCVGNIDANGNITITSITADNAVYKISASKANLPTLTKDFTLTKVRAGQSGGNGEDAVIYELQPSVNVIKIAKNTTTPTPNTITCNYVKIIGNNAPTQGSGMVLKYQRNTDSAPINYTSAVSTSGIQWIEFTLWNGSVLLDKERVIVVADGDKGDKGEQGLRGLQGLQGDKGEQGLNGKDGTSSYFHLAYADNAQGGGFNQDPTNKAYIGTYVDTNPIDAGATSSLWKWQKVEGAQGEKGENGIAGTNGADGKTYYLHIAYANSQDGSQGFSTTDSVNKLYIGTLTDLTPADSTNYRLYKWSKIKGDKGDKGESITIISTSITYAQSSSGTTPPTSGWTTTIPSIPQGQYLWTKTFVDYSSGDDTTSYSVTRVGVDGDAGTSITITSTSVKYQVSESGVSIPSGTWNETIPSIPQGKYLWTRTIVVYSDNKSTTAYSISRNANDGTNGDGIKSITYQYANSASSTQEPTTWSNTKPTPISGLYLWTKTTTTFNINPTPIITYSNVYYAVDGKGIKSTIVEYAKNTSATQEPTSGWSTTLPTTQEKEYLWSRTTITYTDDTNSVSYSVAYHPSNGKDGVSITILSTQISYAQSVYGDIVPPDNLWSDKIPAIIQGQYLWTRTIVTYNTKDKTTSYSVARTGADGLAGSSITITSTSITYQASTNGVNVPSGAWLDAIPTIPQGQYLWTRTIVTYSDKKSTTAYSVARQGVDAPQIKVQFSVNGIDGWHATWQVGDLYRRESYDNGKTWSGAMRMAGEKGDKGADGKKNPYTEFAYLWSPNTWGNTPSGNWTDVPLAKVDKQNLWERQIKYSVNANNEWVAGSPSYSIIYEYLEIGGVNLLKGTSKNWVNSTNPSLIIIYNNTPTNSIGLKYGDNISLRVKVRNSPTDFVMSLGFTETVNGAGFGLINNSYTAANTENEVFLQGIVPNKGNYLYIVFRTTNIDYSELKLEKGNKSTDWSPAPEDVQSQISDLDYLKNSFGQVTNIDGVVLSKVMGVKDAQGNVVAGMDGSGNFPMIFGGATNIQNVRKSARYQVEKDGKTLCGNPQGKKLIIDPSNATLSFYDNNDNISAIFDGDKIINPESIFGDDVTLNLTNTQFSLRATKQSVTEEKVNGSFTTSEKGGVLVIGNLSLSASFVNPPTSSFQAIALMEVFLNEVQIFSISASPFQPSVTDSTKVQIQLQASTTYTIKTRFTLNNYDNVTYLATSDSAFIQSQLVYASNKQRYFANGFIIGTSNNNFFQVINRPNASGRGEGMSFIARSQEVAIEVSDGEIRMDMGFGMRKLTRDVNGFLKLN